MNKLCDLLNRVAARWWPETLWFFSCALVTLMAGSYFHTGQVFGAKWWEAMTAFGTVGATFGAVYGTLYAVLSSNKARRNAAWGTLRKIFGPASLLATQIVTLKNISKPGKNDEALLRGIVLVLVFTDSFLKIPLSNEEEISLLVYCPDTSEALDVAKREAIAMKSMLQMAGWGVSERDERYEPPLRIIEESSGHFDALTEQIAILQNRYKEVNQELDRSL